MRAGITFSNPLALPPVSAPPLRIPRGPPGSPQQLMGPAVVGPPAQEGGPLTPRLAAHSQPDAQAKENAALPNGVNILTVNPFGEVCPLQLFK